MYYKAHPDYDFKPFLVRGLGIENNPYILRISPSYGAVEFEWVDLKNRDNTSAVVYYSYDGFNYETQAVNSLKVKISVEPERDCRFYVKTEDGRVSNERRFNSSKYPGTVVNYLAPQDTQYTFSGKFMASPSIVRLKNGDLLASMDIFALHYASKLSVICRSKNNGEDWEYVTELFPSFWTSLFTNGDKVYAVSVSEEYGDLQLLESLDNGVSWHGIILEKGVGYSNMGYHRAPTPILHHNGRIWFSMEYGCWEHKKFMPVVFSADENSDIMDPASWSHSEFFEITEDLPGIEKGKVGIGIEGNLVVAPDGNMYNVLRHGIEKVLVLRVDTENPKGRLEFDSFVKTPFCFSKFYIQKHEGTYYCMGNVSPYRNTLALFSSKDIKNWEYHSTIVDYSRMPAQSVGCQYPSCIIEGDTVYALARTAVNGAQNFHDSNCITFHKTKLK